MGNKSITDRDRRLIEATIRSQKADERNTAEDERLFCMFACSAVTGLLANRKIKRAADSSAEQMKDDEWNESIDDIQRTAGEIASRMFSALDSFRKDNLIEETGNAACHFEDSERPTVSPPPPADFSKFINIAGLN